jgi:hypothetical protein
MRAYRTNAQTIFEPLTLEAMAAALVTTEAITQRYCQERIKRGMQKRVWPKLPPEPVEPWEDVPLEWLCRLLHEPRIVEPGSYDLWFDRYLSRVIRYGMRVAPSSWRMIIRSVP